MYQWLREVCTTILLNTPIQLGGPGKVVQMGESLFKKVDGVNLCPIAYHMWQSQVEKVHYFVFNWLNLIRSPGSMH